MNDLIDIGLWIAMQAHRIVDESKRNNASLADTADRLLPRCSSESKNRVLDRCVDLLTFGK